MIKCTTIRPGTPCVHMAKRGCTFAEGRCFPVVEQCAGCGKIADVNGEKFCGMYAKPADMWKDEKPCISATHIEHKVATIEQKLNPLKASKRASRGR